jgi:LPXTG-motif cell wall-anchored protein
VRVLTLHPVRSRARSVAVVAIVATALLLAWARPAWAHKVAVSGTTSCPDANHLVTWTIHNNETLPDRPMTIASVSAEVNGTTYAVTGYDTTVAPDGDTQATSTVPGDVEGTITITVHVRWPDNFSGTATGSVELTPPCNETTTTTTPSTTTPTTTATTAPSSSTSPPVTGGTAPSTAGPGPSTGGAPAGVEGGVQGAEAGGTLPRTGADATNWALVGLTALLFGAALVAVSAKRVATRR